MENTSPETPVASLPDSPQVNYGQAIPNNLAVILHAAGILLGYGRHLIDTLRQRATAPNFSAIAANFGTANLSTILAHLNRGLLRAAILERVLLVRAATGKDIEFVERRTPAPQEEPAQADTQPGQPAEPLVSARNRAPRLSRPAGRDDPELFMPTPEDLERQVRRRPIGRTILDICLDLAVVPGFCHSAFWNELFDVMNYFGGSGSVAKLMQEKTRRRAAYDKEQDRNPNANWDWINATRDALHEVLGFFIGEPPVNPLDPAAAIATAPP